MPLNWDELDEQIKDLARREHRQRLSTLGYLAIGAVEDLVAEFDDDEEGWAEADACFAQIRAFVIRHCV